MSIEERSRFYDFNTAITPYQGPHDTADNANHKEATHDLWLRFKAYDGITECFVARYGVRVKYLPSVVTATQIDEIVREEVAWATNQENLFPHKREKTPQASYERSNATPELPSTVLIMFGTQILPYEVNMEGVYNSSKFRHDTQSFRNLLCRTDGITDCDLSMDGVRLAFDPDLTNYDTVKEHAVKVIEAVKHEEKFFPFLDDPDDLNLRFGS